MQDPKNKAKTVRQMANKNFFMSVSIIRVTGFFHPAKTTPMTQETSPQITLCIPVLNEEKTLPGLFSNLSSYFDKFMIPFEVVFCLDPSTDSSENILKEAHRKNSSFRYFANPRKLGRAQSLLRAIKEAKSPYIATASTDLSIPLGDLMKLLQSLGEKQASIAFGTRIDKKDSPFFNATSKKARLEITYMNIFWEQKRRQFKDPFCHALVFKREIRDLLLENLKVSGWYLTLNFQDQVFKKKIPFTEVPVYTSISHEKAFPYRREQLRLFWRSLSR